MLKIKYRKEGPMRFSKEFKETLIRSIESGEIDQPTKLYELWLLALESFWLNGNPKREAILFHLGTLLRPEDKIGALGGTPYSFENFASFARNASQNWWNERARTMRDEGDPHVLG